MQFRIADTFTDSLAKLTGDEQKAVKTTAFDLQLNPANPGMQFHKLDRARDPHFWSVRVNRDIRLIVHRTNANLLLCFVDHHDKAYRWAERRKLESHPKTGAAQLVEIRETVKEITIPKYVESEAPATPKLPLFADQTDEELLGYGVPPEWLDDVRSADEDSLFDVAAHLPSEAAEALLELVTGGTPQVSQPVAPETSPFEHPDAQRRFRLMANIEELKQALEFPWEKWAVFLLPAQRDLVERQFNGPAKVAGTAGTGKTVVALHRAAFLARNNPKAKILLTTFSDTLANLLRLKLQALTGNDRAVLNRIAVHSITDIGRRLYAETFGMPKIADEPTLREMLAEASKAAESHRFSDQFPWTEWNEVVDAWQIDSWEAYSSVPRLGRKTRLGESQRRLVWGICEQVRDGLQEQDLQTVASLFARLTSHLRETADRPFDFAVVDEAQDIGVPELRFLAALGADRPNGLFFAGDLGQRIFQPPFSWKSLGVDIRGRSRTLRVNYRTSHQIRTQADRLLGPEISDVDGNTEDRRNTISVFDGADPDILTFETPKEEIAAVGKWLSTRMKEGVRPHEVGVFVRSAGQFNRAVSAVEEAQVPFRILDENAKTTKGHVSISTMHLAKGVEFRTVVVMACDDELVPLQERIETVADNAELEEVYNTERHLLYVACTRARDHLLVTSGDTPSEFLDDLLAKLD